MTAESIQNSAIPSEQSPEGVFPGNLPVIEESKPKKEELLSKITSFWQTRTAEPNLEWKSDSISLSKNAQEEGATQMEILRAQLSGIPEEYKQEYFEDAVKKILEENETLEQLERSAELLIGIKNDYNLQDPYL